MPPRVKICGLTEQNAIEATVKSGADFIGFVFYPPSPRAITPANAALLAPLIPDTIQKVGLFVNPSDKDLEDALNTIDMIQLHGDETPQRCEEIKILSRRPIIKALKISSADDLEKAALYNGITDWILFDAAPPDAALPGGTGESFDWALLQNFQSQTPWMLAGGLDVQNVQKALSIISPDAVDISSGVENSPGHKNPDKITKFIEAVRGR